MKKLLIFLLAIMAMVACSDDSSTVDGDSTPSIVISKAEYVVSSDGETIAIEVTSNVNVTVELPTDVDWISENTTRTTSTNTYYFDIAKNEDYEQRSAELKFTNKENNLSEVVKITQAQKDAIVLAKSEYEFGTDGGNLDFEIQTNVDVTVTISDNATDWIQQVETRALDTKSLYFDVSACSSDEEREGTITISGGCASQTITVKQSGLKEILKKEREALIAFYNATGGDDWTHNDNWCSDKPVSEWYGVYTVDYKDGESSDYKGGRVLQICLGGNNLTGSINGELDVLTELRLLEVNSNNLTGIQMSKNEKLYHLACWENTLKTIDITGLVGLELLTCFDNDLKTIDVSTNINLLDFQCGNNQISAINLGNNSKLWQLSCCNNPIKEINTDNLINLTWLNCAECSLTKLSINSCTELEGISCDSNSITELDVSNNSKLVQLLCDNNPIERIDLSNCSLLETLWCNECQLKELDVSMCPNLQILLGSNNELSDIDISHNPELNTLWCGGNNLSELNVSNNPKLNSLVCGNGIMQMDGNRISNIDVSNNLELETLVVTSNKLSNLDVTKNTKLRQLELHSNNIHHIDLSRNIQLEALYYAYNGVSQLDLSNTPLLKHLECSNNNIETVDLSKNTNLVNLYCSSNNFKELDISYSPNINILSCGKNPYLTKIYVNSSQKFEYWKDDIAEFIYKDGGGGEEPDKPSYYESTDYSQDGIVTKLQSATKGKGIDIVLMGDGYSDRLITDGTYDRVMNTAMEKFFIEEPYKSFRDYFNVYNIKAVSKNEVFTINSDTAFAGYFGGDTHVGGNDQRVFSYAEKAVGAERMDDALIVVMMNSEAYAGTCYMYYPTDNDNWGDGVSISYFPIGVDDNALAQVLQHEAGGHGFSKLADEYESFFYETITTDAIASIQAVDAYGWHKNIDLTSDPTQVKWSHFLTDSRYANEGLGVYEGAFVFKNGVYRPSWNSIMRDNTGGFNAPSREAIYYRIHKLAYGEDWEYDYEKFVEYDAINRTTATATRGVPYRLDIPEGFKPLHPPVIINTSWRNAKDNTPAKNATRSMGGNVGHNLQKSAGATSHATTKPMSITSSVTIDLLNSTKLTITTTSSGAKSEIVTTR